jgi:hypothetical protein
VLIICHEARQAEGFWYLATIALHLALSMGGFAGKELVSFVMMHGSLSLFWPQENLPHLSRAANSIKNRIDRCPARWRRGRNSRKSGGMLLPPALFLVTPGYDRQRAVEETD